MSAEALELDRRALTLLDELLELSPAERDTMLERETEGDPALRQRVSRILGSLASIGDRIATGGAAGDFSLPEPPEKVGAYRVVELLGQGGMGAVFRAERDVGDFEHEVAIKIIRPGAFSVALVDRFHRERQTLARLAHPNIARLLDGGETEAGEPFIVMEYINGTPILEWAEDKALGLDARLKLFLAAAGAVSYAHQNLVIHRDLTPPNVLVDREGAPKVIDFGIARPPGPADAAVSQSDRTPPLSLTPGFAAPERMTGAPASTLTDIFSLGKLLEALIERWADDRDLAAIIASAANSDPGARYPSADALIEDIDRYRSGHPVQARGGGRRYAIGKFARRHRGSVLAAAVVLFLLLGAFVLTLRAYSGAEAAREEADRRFNQVRGLATTLMFDVYDRVDDVPGSTAAKEALASTAQQYLDALASDPDAPFDVRLEAGRGYKRLADVMGGPGGGTLGQREQAMVNYVRADAILSALHAENPASEAAALALADLRYIESAAALHFDDDMEKGLERARSISSILDRECRDRDTCAIARVQGMLMVGENLHWLERLDEAVAIFDRALASLASLSAEARASEEGVRIVARAHRLKGNSLYYLEDISGSVRELGVASQVLKRAMARGIVGSAIERDLAIIEWDRGGALDEFGRPDDGVEALNTAYSLMEEQVAADPDDVGSLRLLAVVGGQRALTSSAAGRHEQAIAGGEASLAIRRRLSAGQPEESGFFRDVIIMIQSLGDMHRRAGNERLACGYYRETIKRFDALDRRWGMSEFDRNDTYARTNEALESC